MAQAAAQVTPTGDEDEAAEQTGRSLRFSDEEDADVEDDWTDEPVDVEAVHLPN